MTTIFKSGRNPGEFTRLISTIYYDERRRRREVISPQSVMVEASRPADMEIFNSNEQEELPFETLLVQSGRNF